jgi:hypothetical protein
MQGSIRLVTLATCLGAVLCPSANGTLTVRHTSGQAFHSSDVIITSVGTNLWEIELIDFFDASGLVQLTPDYVIRGTGGEDINKISVNVSTGAVISLDIQSMPTTNGINDVNQIVEDPNAGNILTTISDIIIKGDLGSVNSDGIANIVVDGTITGPIVAHDDGTTNGADLGLLLGAWGPCA